MMTMLIEHEYNLCIIVTKKRWPDWYICDTKYDETESSVISVWSNKRICNEFLM